LHVFHIDVKLKLITIELMQLSIYYVINITENIYTASILQWLRVCRSSGV